MARVTFLHLISLRRHADHKLLGLLYIVSFIAQVGRMALWPAAYEQAPFYFHMICPLTGIFVTLSAIRNFHKVLPKDKENKGMFAEGRTFSLAFLIENLWFQVLLCMTLAAAHPGLSELLSPYATMGVLWLIYTARELVPKTSYKSWDDGNKKINPTKLQKETKKAEEEVQKSVTWISIQVKLVRWNFVFKKYFLYYLFAYFQMAKIAPVYAHILPGASYVQFLERTSMDRIVSYLLTLDAMHNVTTAFFFQTLKFKGFISPEFFAFLFNATPILGVFLTAYILSIHHFLWPLFLAGAVECFINLFVLYPNKSIPVEWKNRCQTTLKVIGFFGSLHFVRESASFQLF